VASTTLRVFASEGGVPAHRSVSLIDTTRRQLLTAGGTLAAFGACPCATCGECRQVHVGVFLSAAWPTPIFFSPHLVGAGSAQAGEWSYGAYEGPRMWGAMCREGTAQSPININTSASPLRSAPDVRFQFNYASSVRSIVNTGARTSRSLFIHTRECPLSCTRAFAALFATVRLRGAGHVQATACR
jgi:hypothetical protein